MPFYTWKIPFFQLDEIIFMIVRGHGFVVIEKKLVIKYINCKPTHSVKLNIQNTYNALYWSMTSATAGPFNSRLVEPTLYMHSLSIPNGG